MSNFSQTVDLKKKAQQSVEEKRTIKKKLKNIDKVFDEADDDEIKKINRPAERQVNEALFKKVVLLIAFVFLISIFYIMFFKDKDKNVAEVKNSTSWYAVKLVDEEIFYGQIADTSADPVVIQNVYYNYDQGKESESNESGSLRLVKRGKESHGPDGTMNIVRTQILYMETLKSDSKVLNAILDYEN